MEWISVKDRLPEIGEIVDLWDGKRRHTEYKINISYNGQIGNDFFSPVRGGVTVIRYHGESYYTNATHWMPLPEPPNE